MVTVVTRAGSLTCGHAGSPSLTSPAKLTVSREPVLLYADVPSFTPLSGCTFSTSSGNKPCTAIAPSAGGLSSKLTAGSRGVLLQDLQAGTDNPPPPPSVTVLAGQSKLTAS